MAPKTEDQESELTYLHLPGFKVPQHKLQPYNLHRLLKFGFNGISFISHTTQSSGPAPVLLLIEPPTQESRGAVN